MDKSKTWYVFFDFDGTVTTVNTFTMPDGKTDKGAFVPDCHINSIKKLKEAGHKVFLCTGRSRGSFLNMGRDFMRVFLIPWDGMIFGASDLWYENKRIGVTYISREECLFWFDYCRETKKVLCYNGTEKPVRYDFTTELTNGEIDALYADVEKQMIENPITNLSTIPCAADVDKSRTDLTVVHLSTYSDAFPPSCDKGSAIKRFCGLIGADIEQTVCFGDSENDIDMFLACNTGVAMKKAPEGLKAIAAYSAEGEYGVSEGIEHIFGL